MIPFMAEDIYLNLVRIDNNKGGKAYSEQTVVVHFSKKGEVLTYGDKDVIIDLLPLEQKRLRIYNDPDGTMYASGLVLTQNPSYVTEILAKAKKPLLSKKLIR